MRFNKLFKKKAERQTVNLAGGEAHGESEKLELATLLLTSFLDDQFYRSGNAAADRVKALVAAIPDKEFAAKAALYARHEGGIRSATHLVAGEIAHRVKGAAWAKRFFDRIVRRPDDAVEILAYSLLAHGKPVPNALKKGLGSALARFDAYQLAKYRRNRAELKLVDAVNLLHPPHTEALAALVNGSLAAPETWEARLTQAGQAHDAEAPADARKAKAWADLIRDRKIGYFALLRNLRNIAEQSADSLGAALAMLVEPARIRRSLVLPFRFRQALDAVAESKAVAQRDRQRIMAALEQAAEISLANVPRFAGRTLVALDCSGSMIGRPMKVGSLFAAVLFKANEDADLMLFSGDARYETPSKGDSALTLAARIEGKAEWSGTNFHAIFDRAQGAYDRVVILSDMQAWIGHHTPAKSFAKFAERTGRRPRVFTFDLAGYGTLQFPERDVFALAGFSEKSLELMQLLESDKRALLRKIEAVEV